MTLLGLAEAHARLLDQAEPLPAHRVAVRDAHNHYASSDILARRTQPAADFSAMDGYAVRADDLGGPWRLVGESAAGHPFGGVLGTGEAIRISTGALMPTGPGAVLLQENARRAGDRVALNGEGDPSPRHIRRAGFDFRTNDVLLPAGTRLGPAQIALALAGGNNDVDVHALPSVVVLDSGDELSDDAAACAPHQIPASNGAMLAAMVATLATSVRRIGPVADRAEALQSALVQASDADVVVTSGGASVGDHDLVRPALEAWGAKIDFWRVAIRPGKPVLVARKGGQWILGLPGNPVSSYVTAYLFVLPLLRRLAGARSCLPRPVKARTTRAIPGGGDRQEFMRAALEGSDVTPIDERDSSALRSLATANALINRPIGTAPAAPGDEVEVYLLENGGIA